MRPLSQLKQFPGVNPHLFIFKSRICEKITFIIAKMQIYAIKEKVGCAHAIYPLLIFYRNRE